MCMSCVHVHARVCACVYAYADVSLYVYVCVGMLHARMFVHACVRLCV